MVNAIQQARLGVKPPTTYELSGPILDEEAGKLMNKIKHLVWTPRATHNIDLMLEEIGEIKIVKETLQEVRLVSRFI
ncbi:hypothetical protein AMTR_s00161p00071160 [Amborella trichopoda]|uniref:DUF659 domain-containing protein n=1 Tax=Amborella trichopoda TaxID=13333 RepID=W1PT80_AMBTC|nr:hypothetical protein AMTR_s00161p00071160 [Amborella trichopoda]